MSEEEQIAEDEWWFYEDQRQKLLEENPMDDVWDLMRAEVTAYVVWLADFCLEDGGVSKPAHKAREVTMTKYNWWRMEGSRAGDRLILEKSVWRRTVA